MNLWQSVGRFVGFKPEVLNRLSQFAEHGSTKFQGYLETYHYNQVGYAEVSISNCALQYPNSQELVRFGHVSNTFMACVINEPATFPANDLYSPDVLCVAPVLDKNLYADEIFIHPLHPDVLPSLARGAMLSLQVTFIAKEVFFFPKHEINILFSSEHRIKIGTFQKNDEEYSNGTCNILARISGFGTIQETKLTTQRTAVLLQTQSGMILLVANGLHNCSIGDYVQAKGWIVGDCAVEKYQKGARYDLEADYKVLFDALSLKRFNRLSSILSERCKYYIGDKPKRNPDSVLRKICEADARDTYVFYATNIVHSALARSQGRKGLYWISEKQHSRWLVFIGINQNGLIDVISTENVDLKRKIEFDYSTLPEDFNYQEDFPNIKKYRELAKHIPFCQTETLISHPYIGCNFARSIIRSFLEKNREHT